MLSQSERWTQDIPEVLVAAARPHRNYELALRTVGAVNPSLARVGEGLICENGDVKVCLRAQFDPDTQSSRVSILVPEGSGDSVESLDDESQFKVLHTREGEQARDLVAAFLLDFPDSMVCVPGGVPLILILGDSLDKRVATLNNMIAASEQGLKKVVVAVPKVTKRALTTNRQNCRGGASFLD